MNNNVFNTQGMFLSTYIFGDICHDTKIPYLCNEVTTKVPGSFSCLRQCDLFSEGLLNIVKSSNNVLNNFESFSAAIDSHCESIVNKENQLNSNFNNLPDLIVSNDI